MDINDTLSESFDSAMADPEPQDVVTEDVDIDESTDSEAVIEEDQSTEVIEEEEGAEEKTEPELEAIKPPTRWSAADKAVFESLPRDAQELVLKREGDVESYLTKRSQEQADTKKRYDALDQVLESRREQWAIEGTNEGQVVSQLFSISDYADKDPMGFVNWFAQQRGLDLNQMAAHQPQVDPALLQTQQELANIKRSIAERDQNQLQSEQAAADSEIQAFIDGGSAPHFETVRTEMAHMINSGEATTIQDAYDRAVWANPETRNLMQNQLLEERKAEATEKAKKAKKVKAAQLQSSGVGASDVTTTIDDTLSRSYDNANAG